MDTNNINEENTSIKPTKVDTVLTAKASEKLEAEVEEDLKKKDPPNISLGELLIDKDTFEDIKKWKVE